MAVLQIQCWAAEVTVAHSVFSWGMHAEVPHLARCRECERRRLLLRSRGSKGSWGSLRRAQGRGLRCGEFMGLTLTASEV